MESTLPYILEHGPDELVAQLPQSTGEHSALTAFAIRVLGEATHEAAWQIPPDLGVVVYLQCKWPQLVEQIIQPGPDRVPIWAEPLCVQLLLQVLYASDFSRIDHERTGSRHHIGARNCRPGLEAVCRSLCLAPPLFRLRFELIWHNVVYPRVLVLNTRRHTLAEKIALKMRGLH